MAPERLSSGPLDVASSSLQDEEDTPEEHRVWEKANPMATDGGAERGEQAGRAAQQEQVGRDTREGCGYVDFHSRNKRQTPP